MKFGIYDKTTGELIRTGACPPSVLSQQPYDRVTERLKKFPRTMKTCRDPRSYKCDSKGKLHAI
jgi:hypothetical protein